MLTYLIIFIASSAHELQKREARVGTSRCDLRIVGGETVWLTIIVYYIIKYYIILVYII